MSAKPEHIGDANRVLRSVSKNGAKSYKVATSRWRRRQWRVDIEAPIEKYFKGWVA